MTRSRCSGRTAPGFSTARFELRAGDIADEEADALVSSANYEMTMRTGVGDALRRRGGDDIEKEAMKDGEHALGECVATRAGTLRAEHVLHAVSAWNETSCVGRAMQRALSVADRLGLRTLAFPALGTGSARVSMETCADAMMTALRWRLLLGGSRLQKVTIVLGDEAKLSVFRDVAVEALRGGRPGRPRGGPGVARRPGGGDARRGDVHRRGEWCGDEDVGSVERRADVITTRAPKRMSAPPATALAPRCSPSRAAPRTIDTSGSSRVSVEA